jgi:hypothetical protein
MAILVTSSTLEKLVKIPPAHPKNVGGARFVPSCIRYGSDDEFAFHVVDSGAELNREARFRNMSHSTAT